MNAAAREEIRYADCTCLLVLETAEVEG